MVPTSHLSTISFYFISRSTDVWVSTHLASSILLAISALFFHREPSAGTHGVFVFVFIGTKCWNPRRYCLCFHIGNQVLELTALLSLLSFLVPGHLARSSTRNTNVTPRPSKYGIVPWSETEGITNRRGDRGGRDLQISCQALS